MIPPPDSCQTTALYAPGETMVTLRAGDLPLSVTSRPLASAGVLHANPSKATRVILCMTRSWREPLKGTPGWERACPHNPLVRGVVPTERARQRGEARSHCHSITAPRSCLPFAFGQDSDVPWR